MIPFIDLAAQRARLGQPLEDAILKVVRSGAYIMGPEIAQFEAELCAFGQAPHALSCGSGTEALVLPLMAWGVGPGDAVFCARRKFRYRTMSDFVISSSALVSKCGRKWATIWASRLRADFSGVYVFLEIAHHSAKLGIVLFHP